MLPPVRVALRARELWRHRAAAVRQPRVSGRFLVSGREVTNFTYPITNMAELEAFVAAVVDAPLDRVRERVREAEDDRPLRDGLARKLATRHDRADAPHFGRRLVWYCLIRLERPRIVVETGTHDGLGTALMVAALVRNAQEGHPGELHSFDIDPAAGWLTEGQPADRFTLHRGDIRETLPAVLGASAIDMFVHDSLHTYEQERFEYRFALDHRAVRIVLVSDNARTGSPDDAPETTHALRDACGSDGGSYAVFRERPLGHFTGGGTAGVGVFAPESR